MKILAIETSCDETAIAIVEVQETGQKIKFKVLGNNLNSQIKLHSEYGGVFPNLAKREHEKNLPIVLGQTLKEAKIKMEKIDAILVTVGPGLEPALWTGIVFAQELNTKYKIPIVPVNHMEGHVFSIFPKKGKTFSIDLKEKIFPALSLLVSGGHTELILIKDWPLVSNQNKLPYKKIGQTRDDACGEAFDKVARMLELPYPGGPEISRLANMERRGEGKILDFSRSGSSSSLIRGPEKSSILSKQVTSSHLIVNSNNLLSPIQFPRPMINSKDYDFSFSGLKTAVLYFIRDLKKENPDILQNQKVKQAIAKEFEDAVVETLVSKTIKAIKEYKIKTLIVGGGVSANSYLQEQMKNKIKKGKIKTKIHFPSKELTGDNALMIAIAGYFQYKKGVKTGKLKAEGNLSL